MKRIQVIARPRADRDAEEFFLYLGLDVGSAKKANEFVDALERGYQRLSEHPDIGAAVPNDNPRLVGLCMWPVPGFPDRLIYFVPRATVIDVVRVLGASQDRDGIIEGE